MWGRIDAAYRLAQVLVDPARLRQRGLAPDLVAEVVERIAFGDEGRAGVRGLPRGVASSDPEGLGYLGDRGCRPLVISRGA